MTFWKKRISLALALVLVTGMLAVPVYAQESGGWDPMDPDAMISNSSSMSFGASEEKAAEDTPAEELPVEEEQPEETAQVEPEEMGWTSDEPTEPAVLLEGDVCNDVPMYFQTDYPDVPYSDGTVATSGCSMASIAMVAAYLRDEEWSPADLARRFGNYEASNIQRMESAATVLDLTYKKVFQWSEVEKSLRQGKIAIVLVDKRTQFTTTQHFLVLTGISADGRIYLNDSYAPNYTKWELRDGFLNGFDPKVVSCGFGGAWVFNEYIPPEKVESRYTGVTLTEEEKYLLARIIWLEARGESFDGQQAIAEIVLNRLVSDRFPNTIRDVIYAEGQFSTTKFLDTAKPGELQYKAIECAMTQKSVLPMDVFFFGRAAKTSKVWGKIGGHTFCYCEQ